MIVLDVNLLMYSYLRASPFHRVASRWFESVLSGSEQVGIPLHSVSGFIRITTHPRFSIGAVDLTTALSAVDSWLAEPNVNLLYPAEQHWPILRKMLIKGQALGDMSSDAHLAAITMENGGTLYTTDRDFARFPGLRWTNPLAANV